MRSRDVMTLDGWIRGSKASVGSGGKRSAEPLSAESADAASKVIVCVCAFVVGFQ